MTLYRLFCFAPTLDSNLYESTLMMSFYTVGDRYQIYNDVSAEDAFIAQQMTAVPFWSDGGHTVSIHIFALLML